MRRSPLLVLTACLLVGTAASSLGAPVRKPAPKLPYLVGAASRDITPVGPVNLGGFGLGDGSVLPEDLVGSGNVGQAKKERIRTRAIVFDDGVKAIAIATVETQGMFAVYQDGKYGLLDMANAVAKAIPRLPADRIIIAADHTHSGPDTIGVWGGVPPTYLEHIKTQTVAAIKAAYAARKPARIRSGHSDASDLIYNQSCSEALNQDEEPAYPGPELCATPGKDGIVRVLQATDAKGKVIATYMAFAAHATAGGGDGLHGDWPQFVSDAMTATYGGTGIAMVGALGGTQPCRAACAFTKPENPGYALKDRRSQITTNYMAHVALALADSIPVIGPVDGTRTFIREPITGPAVIGLFTLGHHLGTKLLRSHENPWVVGETIRTVVSTARVGGVLFVATPGEGFDAIGTGVRAAVTDEEMVVQLGLANDQLGYLIAPVQYVPIIAAQVAVNDNIIFNVSPTIGDHVMCTSINNAIRLRFTPVLSPQCVPYTQLDSMGDPIAALPIGGIIPP